MKTWEIRLNGSPYSYYTSNLCSKKDAETVVAEWKAQTARLGYTLMSGEYTAQLYIETALDFYGN